ncbi:GNAT family N-acetyltransferase [Parapedobacter defluvii]|uniref:GNAT family N-acetyltransferase n=1 Tax=Parapedobacter defluvii TaxID=2045106 RepID=UPI000FA2654D|nr:MAG: N-acetyltransferase [Parapedobacter sp.]
MFFFERTIHHRAHTYETSIDEPHELSGGGVVLNVLTYADNQEFFDLYAGIAVHGQLWESPILPNETAECFTKRIVSRCEMLWTIRLADCPTKVIGDCALHHWNRETHEIEFGGSLLPTFWGKGIMAAALALVAAFAATSYGVKVLRCNTSSTNHNARRFAEKMGFKPLRQSDSTVLLSKFL